MIKKLFPDLALPQYQTAGSAGMDLAARLDAPVTIARHEVATWEEATDLDETTRGTDGFGSTRLI